MIKNYISGDELNNEVLKPLMSSSKNINIATGYFSVKIFEYFKKEFFNFLKFGEKIRLIIGNDTSLENIEFFRKIRNISNGDILKLIEENYFKDYKILSDEALIVIYNLLKNKKIEIKIGYSTNKGIFHAKDYLFENEEKIITIKGSLNFTTNALVNNYESVIATDDKGIYYDSLKLFNTMWDNVDINFAETKTIEEHLLLIVEKEICEREIWDKVDDAGEVTKESKIQLRDYQEEAINDLFKNDFNGLLEMATGTGKTFTVLYGLKKLFEDECGGHLVIIVVPYQHLATQWVEEIQGVFGKKILVLECHSHAKWENNLNIYIQHSYEENVFLVMVDKTFFNKLDRLGYSLEYINDILVIDEAHNLTKEKINTLNNIPYIERKIALSATPNHYFDDKRTESLFDYFKGAHFKYGLEEAIKNNYLTAYEYIPTVIALESEEERKYKQINREIKKELNNVIRQKLMDERSEILSNARQKLDALVKRISEIDDMKQSLIYCNSGKNSFDKEHDYTHIEQTAKVIKEECKNLNLYKITYRENNEERKKIVEFFKNKDIDAILAIRCLDEGYNIPAIKRAFILSSSRNPKEYIQRRGRVLRLFEGKEISYIYDFIVSVDGVIPKEEKIRFDEYSSLAMNIDELEKIKNKEIWSEDE